MSEEKKPQKKISELTKEELVSSIHELRNENMQLEIERRTESNPTILANKEHIIEKNMDKIIDYMNRLDELNKPNNRQR